MSNTHDDSPDDSLTPTTGPYRSLSAKRFRDPSNRKSVSFNDVPIVHEVPSYDTMRNSNSDIYRSWTFTETTSPISVLSPILQPFNSSSPAAQKLHASRLSSLFYASSSSPTINRPSDWSLRTKSVKTMEESNDYIPPSIVIHRPDEQLSKTSSHLDTNDEKKHSYRPALLSDTEHYRSLPFTYVPLSESTTTYTSMLSNNVLASNESTSNGLTRNVRVRSATLPITVLNNSSPRNHETISVTSLRSTTNITTPINSSSRSILKPATIAFHSSTNTSTNVKPPPVPPRSHSFTAHSRLISSSTRPLSSSNKRSTSSTILSRTRSANISSTKRQLTSPLDGSTSGTPSNNIYTTKRNLNIKPSYTSSSPSSSIHHFLLPAHIN